MLLRPLLYTAFTLLKTEKSVGIYDTLRTDSAWHKKDNFVSHMPERHLKIRFVFVWAKREKEMGF